jgi:hypothetical protein
MLEPMNEHLIKDKNKLEIQFNSKRYTFNDIPESKLENFLSVLNGLAVYKEEISKSWRDSETIQNFLKKHGDNLDTQPGAAALKSLRLDKKFSQKKLAELINRDQGIISKLERGSIPIGKILAKRFGSIFDVDYRIFL